MNNFKDNPRPLEKVKKIKENIINNKEETNKTEKESKIGKFQSTIMYKIYYLYI